MLMHHGYFCLSNIVVTLSLSKRGLYCIRLNPLNQCYPRSNLDTLKRWMIDMQRLLYSS